MLERGRNLGGVLRAFGVLLLVFGAMMRVAPLLDHEDRMLKQWPTEDGYLMLTIARNMALGHGMSTSNGELPTNGTQPLATGVWALAFAMVDSDKPAGVFVVLLMQFAFSGVSALLLYLVAREVFRRVDLPMEWALVVAGLWYSSSLVVPHSMNCLESGLYVTLVLAVAWLYLRLGVPEEGRGAVRFSWPAILALGGALGACFWARNDAVFLIAAFCLCGLLRFAPGRWLEWSNLPRMFVAGLITVVIAMPWLLNNIFNFGHLMPISGVAQSAGSPVAVNAPLVPVKLLEYLGIVLPVPHVLETNSVLVVLCSVAVLAAAIAAAVSVRRLVPELRHFVAFIASFGVMLLGYYGVVHGAPHFMARYLFPLSPFIAVLTVGTLAALTGRAAARPACVGACVVLAAASAVSLGLNVRIYANGSYHMHQQVVDWVAANVRDSDWIGAVQTGTLGFFHDRTVNLDGKVNPEALEAVLSHTIPDYVNRKGLVVLADWYGISEWVALPGISGNFEVLEADRERNLGVLGRVGWSSAARENAPSPFHRP